MIKHALSFEAVQARLREQVERHRDFTPEEQRIALARLLAVAWETRRLAPTGA